MLANVSPTCVTVLAWRKTILRVCGRPSLESKEEARTFIAHTGSHFFDISSRCLGYSNYEFLFQASETNFHTVKALNLFPP